MLILVLAFILKSQGDGNSEERAIFIERLLQVVENHKKQPRSGICQGNSREESIDEIRQGMTSNMALITAAIRSRKGCLAPKIDFLPQSVVAQAEEFRLEYMPL